MTTSINTQSQNLAKIIQAAANLGQTSPLEFQKLDGSKQSEVVDQVAQTTGLPAPEVREALLSQWTANIEKAGQKLQQQGGAGAYLGATEQRSISGTAMDHLLQSKAPAGVVGTFGPEQLNMAQGKEVISNAQKFIIPVPSFASGGEPLVYPEGHEQAGESIVDWKGNPIGDSGLVFFNGKDKSHQAVKGDGNGVVIINQVTEEQGAALLEKIAKDPNTLSLGELKEALRFAQEELGLNDMYNSDRDFIQSKMNPLESAQTETACFGLHRRDDRDICQAVYIEGQGEFKGPAASPQKFEDGAVIVQQGDSQRLVQPEIFVQTYAAKDGTPLSLGDLPVQQPE